jgi:deoxyribose-phosphate aldolase
VKPYAVRLAAAELTGSETCVGTVIGFPHGSSATAVKAFEADFACGQGAMDLDLVVNIGKVITHDWDFVRGDIYEVLKVARRHGAILKVIFETDHITHDDDKVRLCEICTELGVDFVKTSTGFGLGRMKDGGYGYRGATEHDVQLMRAHSGPAVQVKASGGIRTREDANRMLQLGATRLGTSASETIVG